METIEVTFPIDISPQDVILIIEGNLKQNSNFTCTCKYNGREDGEHVFNISSEDGPNAFYLIGMTASIIIQIL